MVIAMFVLLYVLAAVVAFPTAFFLMLFLGNVGLPISFWAVYPGAIVLVSTKLTTIENNKTR